MDVVQKMLRVANFQFGDRCDSNKLEKLVCGGDYSYISLYWRVEGVTHKFFTVKFYGINSSSICLYVRFRYDDCNMLTLDQIKF